MKLLARLIANWLTSLIYRLIGRPRVDVSKKAEKIDTSVPPPGFEKSWAAMAKAEASLAAAVERKVTRLPETADPAKVSQDSLGRSLAWRPVLDGKIPANYCTLCVNSAVVLRHHEGKDLYRYHCQRCLKIGPTANTIRGAWCGWNEQNPNATVVGTPIKEAHQPDSTIEPATPLTQADPGGSINTGEAMPSNGQRISVDGLLASPPILLPEATDPTDSPGWIDDKYGPYDPNYVNK